MYLIGLHCLLEKLRVGVFLQVSLSLFWEHLNSFCSMLCRSEPDHRRRVSPHSERRRLQRDHGALPDAEAQERQAEERAEAHRAPPPDPGLDRFTGGGGGHQDGQGRGAHTASKSCSQFWPLFHLDFSSTLSPTPVLLTQSSRIFFIHPSCFQCSNLSLRSGAAREFTTAIKGKNSRQACGFSAESDTEKWSGSFTCNAVNLS